MDIEQLEEGFKQQLPALENFLKTILLKKINAEMTASSTADTAMVIEALKTGTVVARCKDESFGSDVFFAFDENWIPQLSLAMLGMEEHDVNEVTRDLIKEFTSQLMGTAQVSLQENDIPIEPGEIELIKSGQITNAVPDADYFMAQVDVQGKFEIEGDEQPQLAMIITFAIPPQEKINEVMGLEEEPEPEMEESASANGGGEEMTDEEIEAMMSGTGDEEDGVYQPAGKGVVESERERESRQMQPARAKRAEFEDFAPGSSETSEREVRNLDLLKDVELDISVELGRKEVPLGTILHLVRGSVIELDKLAGEPVEVYANGRRIAEGEVVVIDEHFGVRVTNLVSTRERIESLRS